MAQLKKLIPAGSPTWLEVLGVFGFVGTASVTIIRVNIGVLRGELNNMKEQLQSGTKALRDDVARFQKTLEEQRVRCRCFVLGALRMGGKEGMQCMSSIWRTRKCFQSLPDLLLACLGSSHRLNL